MQEHLTFGAGARGCNAIVIATYHERNAQSNWQYRTCSCSCPRGKAAALEAMWLPRGKAPATQGSVGTWRWRFGPPQYLHLQHIERAVGSLHRGKDQARPKGTCHRVSKTRPRCMKMAANLEHEGESEKHSRHKPQPHMRRPPYRSCEWESVGARREELTPRSSTASSPW